jgi:hypothetical protein
MNRRVIALAVAILFVLSWVFPVGACLASDPTNLPRWWGPVDVALAFVVALGAFGVQVLARKLVDKETERTTYRVYRTLLHALLVIGVLVMVAGGHVKWGSCATGFLWRAWLALYILPWWLACAAAL